MKILAINNWPESLTAEYELIARLKNAIPCEEINRYGYSLETGKKVNFDDFSFALYFHYEAAPILPIKSYLAMINPLSFYYLDNKPIDMKSRVNMFDGFISNLSSKMDKFNHLIGVNELCEKTFFLPTLGVDQISRIEDIPWENKLNKMFYAGINWDFAKKLRKSNFAGENPKKIINYNKKGKVVTKKIEDFTNYLSFEEKVDILDIEHSKKKLGQLNESRVKILDKIPPHFIDIYGPRFINGFFTWVGKINYKGEIPFDGFSLIKKMSEYKFTLCINSIDHQYWQTTSSRVFEALGSGSMPITNKNAHVKDIFGNLIEYYDGDSINDKEQVLNSFEKCLEDPNGTTERLKKCQELMNEYNS